MKNLMFRSVFALLCLLGAVSQAAQFKNLGDWEVHYIVVNTSFLTPEIARSYGIQRSKNRAFVNISVLDASSKQAQRTSVTGTARNLLGQEKQLEFKQIVDGEAIYYIATMAFRHKEKYRFNIDVQQGNQTENLKFEHDFYAD